VVFKPRTKLQSIIFAGAILEKSGFYVKQSLKNVSKDAFILKKIYFLRSKKSRITVNHYLPGNVRVLGFAV